jgi:hypothetical protein
MKQQFPFVPASDLVRMRGYGGTVWYVHKNWLTNYPWRVYDGGGRPRAAIEGSGK